MKIKRVNFKDVFDAGFDLKTIITFFSLDIARRVLEKNVKINFFGQNGKWWWDLRGENRTEGNLSFPTIGDELDNKTKNKNNFSLKERRTNKWKQLNATH